MCYSSAKLIVCVLDCSLVILLIFSCTDEEKVQVVRVAADNIKKLCTQLIDCANHIVQETAQGTGEGNPLSQENSELLRRNWSSQVSIV